jgi:hypothetical protein
MVPMPIIQIKYADVPEQGHEFLEFFHAVPDAQGFFIPGVEVVPGSHFSAHRLLHGLAFRDGGIPDGEHHRVNPVPAAENLLDRSDGQ